MDRPDEADQLGRIGGRETGEALTHAHSRLQRAIARQARLKYTPVLEFEPDRAIEQGMRIDEILRHLHDEDDPDPEEAT